MAVTEASPAVRRAGPADALRLAEFARRTFAETFGPENLPEDMAAFLDASYGVEQQAKELTDPAYITLLVDVGSELAAYAQVRRLTHPDCVTGPSPVELYRFYVDRPWHGRGVAQQLMDGVQLAADELGGKTLWLSVWERNPRALAFYGKCGFADVGSAPFYVGSDRQTDRILAKDVAARSSPNGA